MSEVPIVINSRDRVSCLRELVAWLERAGHERIVILDNASTYEPLLDYLAASPHTIRRLHDNCGSRALWMHTHEWQREPFVYTDPDVVPLAICPLDAVAHLGELLDRFPDFPKAALGLYTDDIPAALDGVARWERSLVSEGRWLAPGVFGSLADTTFALYRAGAPFGYHALRTGAPYQARHLGWYAEANPSDEDRYYLARAKGGPEASSWAARAKAPTT